LNSSTRFHSTCVLAALAFLAAPAQANLIINPIFDLTITANGNATTIEGTINNAIAVYEAAISTNITVNINFAGMNSGLGQSSTYFSNISYSAFHTALVASATDATDASALASLPGTTINPVDGQPDSFIGLNLGLMNLDRTSIDLSKYDLEAVASHEIDEALGLGSGLNGGNVRPEDLFRYSANGVRSYTTSSAATSYFSVDGGATNLVSFNQSGGGADFGDWANSGTHRVQDAFGTPGATPNLGVELTALDAIGYNLTSATPEPATWTMLGFACAGLFAAKRKLRSRL
jgi:hypothetical protein